MISIEELYKIYLLHPSVVTDTRHVKQGDIFFALKGPNFNGNAFAMAALEAGASYVVADEAAYATHPNILLTNDVLQTLQQLALHHRRQFHIPFIGITGSNGKTTTKELVHAVLSSSFITYTTKGNLNNHIGIPLTILSVKPDAQMAVIEMGANHQQEIASYCAYTEPTHGMITNCGKAHLEGFGGVEGVRKGKGELFDYLRTTDGMVWACSDFDYFHTMTQGIKNLVWYGTKEGSVVGEILHSEPFLKMQIVKGTPEPFTIATQLVGDYNAYNVMAAVAIGLQFGVAPEKIKASIEAYAPSNSRSQLMEKDGNHIILDAYNANPSSMAVAIENFARLHMPNKMLFIGGMMELGEDSKEEHQKIVDLIRKYDWKQVVLVGGDFNGLADDFLYFNNSAEAAGWWQQHQTKGNSLLVKGSRSMQMEKIIA